MDPSESSVEDWDETLLSEKYDAMLETLDLHLEKVDACLDEHARVKNSNTGQASTGSTVVGKKRARPQDSFADGVDNYSPFLPKLTAKPNSIIPLAAPTGATAPTEDSTPGCSPATPGRPRAPSGLDMHVRGLGVDVESYQEHDYPHPYETEIREYEYTKAQCRRVVPQKYLPFEQSSCVCEKLPSACRSLCERACICACASASLCIQACACECVIVSRICLTHSVGMY